MGQREAGAAGKYKGSAPDGCALALAGKHGIRLCGQQRRPGCRTLVRQGIHGAR